MESQEELSGLFEYKAGKLFWKVILGKKIRVGDRAGCTNHLGYRQVAINGATYLEHRVIWTMIFGDIPPGLEIDHIDSVKDNNDINNLRLATRSQNKANTGMIKNNTSGFKGVHWHAGGKYWQASIRKDGKDIYLGFFHTPQAASIVYQKAARELNKEFCKY
jgi:HNH endonuclease